MRALFDGKFKGFSKLAEKNIKIAYKHIFGIEYEISKKGKFQWDGFHHDFMGYLEKKGLVKLTNKIVGENGIYKASVTINGRALPKTFFPQDWSREKVINKMMEALQNFAKTGGELILREDGKYRLVASTNEGIRIQFYITPSGKITSAYPIL